jgi:hypothetical protein
VGSEVSTKISRVTDGLATLITGYETMVFLIFTHPYSLPKKTGLVWRGENKSSKVTKNPKK